MVNPRKFEQKAKMKIKTINSNSYFNGRTTFLYGKIFHGIVNYQPQIRYGEEKTSHWVGGMMTRDLVVVLLGEIELQEEYQENGLVLELLNLQ